MKWANKSSKLHRLSILEQHCNRSFEPFVRASSEDFSDFGSPHSSTIAKAPLVRCFISKYSGY